MARPVHKDFVARPISVLFIPILQVVFFNNNRTDNHNNKDISAHELRYSLRTVHIVQVQRGRVNVRLSTPLHRLSYTRSLHHRPFSKSLLARINLGNGGCLET